MTATKKQVIKVIKDMPDDFSWEDIQAALYKMYVIKNVQQGLKDFENGNYMTLEESKKRLLGK
jgi:urate oxidase